MPQHHHHAELFPTRLEELDGNDIQYLRKLIRRDLRHEHKGMSRAKDNDTKEEVPARKRERITHANSVLVKLSGDPSLFFENEVEA
jgi:hypothetical protein